MSGKEHRGRKEEHLTATSPSSLQRLRGGGGGPRMTDTAHGSDVRETELRTEVPVVMWDPSWKRRKEIILSEWEV